MCQDQGMEPNDSPDNIECFQADLKELAAACHERGDPAACAELADVRRAILQEIANRAARR